ncbi:AMP-binding protein [Streptomyces griseoviridis]|uniref:AMP-binding protein n=1 Tax=Streptomyces griseoviridis TaxID=45398 RepID=UPI0033FC9738
MRLGVATVLADSAFRHPDRTAVVEGELRLTYRELWDEAVAFAGRLTAAGVRPGDRVALLLGNTADFPRAYYAVAAAGAVVVPVHALLVADEVAYVLRHSAAVAVVSGGALRPVAEEAARAVGVPVLECGAEPGAGAANGAAPIPGAAPPVGGPRDDGRSDGPPAPHGFPPSAAHGVRPPAAHGIRPPAAPGDLAAVLYTSGTTGRPKGAMLTHLNIVLNATVVARDLLDLRPDDVVLGCLPLFHSYGQTCAMNAAFRAGATLVLTPRFTGTGALDLLVRERVTVFMGVPTMYHALVEAADADGGRPAALRAAVSGGAALPVPLLERFEEVFGTPVLEGYGLTETSPVVTFNQPGARRAGTVGREIWGVAAAIADPAVENEVRLLPDGESGEIVLRGHPVFAGYLDDPEATAATLVDGWLRTGDIGVRDPDGLLRVVDRKKELIIRGGYNVYPREVEEVLARHPAVGQVAVLGVPDDVRGEEVAVVVVRGAGADVSAEELVGWARERLGRHKYPRLVRFRAELPLGPTGKVLKRDLLKLF